MLAVTWPGMGDTSLPTVSSDSATPYWDYILAALKNLIEDERIENPILIGHSAAGPYVINFLHDYPELVAGAVSIDATITNKDTLGYSRIQRIAWAEKDMAEVRADLDSDEAWRNFNERSAGSLGDRAQFYIDMWLTPPREHVFSYWLDWLKTDAGKMVSSIEKPLLSVFAIRASVQDPAAFQREKKKRFEANNASDKIELAYIMPSGHTIWEYQPEAFDDLIEMFTNKIAETIDDEEN